MRISQARERVVQANTCSSARFTTLCLELSTQDLQILDHRGSYMVFTETGQAYQRFNGRVEIY